MARVGPDDDTRDSSFGRPGYTVGDRRAGFNVPRKKKKNPYFLRKAAMFQEVGGCSSVFLQTIFTIDLISPLKDGTSTDTNESGGGNPATPPGLEKPVTVRVPTAKMVKGGLHGIRRCGQDFDGRGH